MKYFSKIIFLFLFSFIIHAQETKNVQPIKVACIGNSITYGSGIADREKNSYPAVLGRILGDGYDVKNFGVSGRTLLRKGDFPYWNEKTYQDALEFLPDIVVIKLGTNDSKPQNWKYKDEFEKDYVDLIDSFKKLKSNPKIFICKPVPAFHTAWGINDSVIVNEMIPMIENISREKNVEIIDLYAPFKDQGNLFSDGIHPNKDGAVMLAKEIYKAIIK
ncbi:MAG: GDSL-type esterase/lipase family protein [Ignavibacteriales bacterium]|nr:GDSL-type esterase/lipase family protein [Ignavibacteriales bacterium]